MENVLISGGTGLVGTRLTTLLLEKGHTVSCLSRDGKGDIPNVKYYQWNPRAHTLPEEAILKADQIINLAGANLFSRRWTPKFKRTIIESRIDSTSLLVGKLNTLNHNIKTFISVSATGYYGADSPKKHFESDGPGNDFLAGVCASWEVEASKLLLGKTRLIIPRIGIVLSTNDGALKEISRPVRYFVGVPLGNGKQIVPWIHIDDLCRMFIWFIENKDTTGVYNAVGPNPLSNITLTKSVANVLKRPLWLPAFPAFIFKLLLGEMFSAVIGSSDVSARKIIQSGFQFQHPEVGEALEDLFRRGV